MWVKETAAERYHFAPSRLSAAGYAHTVQRGGRSIDLSPKEFALLEFLMMHLGQAVSRSAIVEQVWKLNFDTMTNVVDVYINYLRRKIDTSCDRVDSHGARR